ncbi:MAG: hypothetical protein K6F64_00695 [Clostridia bacterium]|nr:hypothetical protein [Clostridia bacterium]
MIKLKQKNIGSGWLYFYVHFVTEVVCFYNLTVLAGDSASFWIIPLIYDALAFVPQSLVGRFSDRFGKVPLGVTGLILMAAAGLMFGSGFDFGKYTALVILCIGNAFTHVNGAEVTLRCSGGKLSHSAVFVAGGSFGVITGKLLATAQISYLLISALVITAVPFAILAEYYRKEADRLENPCEGFNYVSEKIPASLIILVATLVVIVRGYMGYGIPTSWNKTTLQTVCLYCIMGVGKAAGGILADAFGVKKVALFSTVAALPFLLLGDEHMFVSLIGVMFFSMTMSITLAMLVSVLQSTPGLAFGFTTIGLFLGSVPIFFFRFTSVRSNCIIISFLTVLCVIALGITLRKDGKQNAGL